MRLYLAVLPSLLGLVLIAALAYWGQYAHQVPELFLVIAGIVAVVTMGMSWANVRYVAERVKRLSRDKPRPDAASATRIGAPSIDTRDELDRIEAALASLSGTVDLVNHERQRDARRYEASIATYANLMAAVSTISLQKINEARLPLHILLENHFGDLNENQEELLGAARGATERASAELSALKRLAELDLGTVALRQDRILPGDLLRAVLPIIQANAAQHGLTLTAEIPRLMPAIRGDAAQLQEALVVLLGEAIAGGVKGDELRLSLASARDAVVLTLDGAKVLSESVRTVLAERVVQLTRGAVQVTRNGLMIRFSQVSPLYLAECGVCSKSGGDASSMQSGWQTPCVSVSGVSNTCRSEPEQLQGPSRSSPNYDKNG